MKRNCLEANDKVIHTFITDKINDIISYYQLKRVGLGERLDGLSIVMVCCGT